MMNKKEIIELLETVDDDTNFEYLIEVTNTCDYKGNNPEITREFTIKFRDNKELHYISLEGIDFDKLKGKRKDK